MSHPTETTAATDESIDVRTAGDAVVITMNAPKRRNALSPALRLGLRAALDEAMLRRDARFVVLTGAGGCFSAGGDIRQMVAQSDPQQARHRLDGLHDIVRLLLGGPKPVIAAVEGQAYGAGFSLAMACDRVIAAGGASFSAAFGRIGLVPDCGLFWTLPQRAGIAVTRELLLTGRPVGTDEGGRLGLVDEAVADGQALEAALAYGAQYRTMAPLSLAATKLALARRPASLEDALAMEADLQSSLRLTEDHRRATAAFLAKQPAVDFRGE